MTSKDLTISLLSLAHTPENVTRIYTEKIQHRPLFLKPNPTTTTTPNARLLRRETRLSNSNSSSKSKSNKKPKPRPLSSRQKRTLQLYALPNSTSTPPLNYETYLPLHDLWVKYIQDLLNLSPAKQHVGPSEAAKLCSADFHGARLEVVRSKCVGRVGIKGVVVKDSMGAFEMVCQGSEKSGEGKKAGDGEKAGAGDGKEKEKERRDKKVLVPKEGTIFKFTIPIPTTMMEGTEKDHTSGSSPPKSERNTPNNQAKDPEGDTTMTSVPNPQPSSNPSPAIQEENNVTRPKELTFELHGDQFIYRAADRANRKFKPHFLKNL